MPIHFALLLVLVLVTACGGARSSTNEPRVTPIDPNALVGEWYGCRNEQIARGGDTDADCFANYVEGDHWTFVDAENFRHVGRRMEGNVDAENEEDAIRERTINETGTYTLRRAAAYESPIAGALVVDLIGGDTTTLLLVPTDTPNHFIVRTSVPLAPARPAPEQLIGQWLRCGIDQPTQRAGCDQVDPGLFYARADSSAATACNASDTTERLHFTRNYEMHETRDDGSVVRRAYRQIPDDRSIIVGDEINIATDGVDGSSEFQIRIEGDRMLVKSSYLCSTGAASPE